MKVAQENINAFYNYVEMLGKQFSHEYCGDLIYDYFKLDGNKIIWLKGISKNLFDRIEGAAQKYLIVE